MKNLFIPNDFASLIKYTNETFESDEQRANYIDELISYFKKNKLEESVLFFQTLEYEKLYYKFITDSKLGKFLPMFHLNKFHIERYCDSLDTIKDKIKYIKYVIKEFEKRNISLEYEKYKKEIEHFKLELKYLTDTMENDNKQTEKTLTIPEPKQDKQEIKKTLKKLVFQGNEESILRIFDLLYNAGFIHTNSYNKRNAIIRDTFLKLDENNNEIEFKNTQLSSVKSQRLKDEIIKKSNTDYTKFAKLLKSLKKIIPEE